MALTRSVIPTVHSALAAAALIAALALAIPLAARESLPGPIQADVVSVHDGDTLEVRARVWLGQVISTKVRLAGVDSPELRGRCHRERRMAEAARDFVRGKLNDPRVTLHDVRYGKYAGRVLARVVTARGEDLGEALVAAGLARRYHGRRRGSWCEQAQNR